MKHEDVTKSKKFMIISIWTKTLCLLVYIKIFQLCGRSRLLLFAIVCYSGQGLSRAAYAKLYTAGFPAILDRKGDLPYVIDNVDTTQYVAAKETTDKLLANEIVLQFLAFGK